MNAPGTIVFRASRTSPCPVCGTGTKSCSATEDELHFCRGEPLPGWKRVKQGDEFHSYRRETDDRNMRNGKYGATAPKPVIGTNWPELAAQLAKNLTAERGAALLANLGLPAEALDALPNLGSGKDSFGEFWSFPEVDAECVVTGISRRYPEPVSFHGELKNKLMMKGAKHGLYVGTGWESRPGPLFGPEGASDLMALHVGGLAVVGRNSAKGGAEVLARFLRRVPRYRDIIIVGDNDERPSKTKPGTNEWPGKEGAQATAAKLADELNRPVKWALPPAQHKDARVWVQALLAKGAKPGSPELMGEIVGWLTAHATTVGHSADTADSADDWPFPIPLSQAPEVPAFPVDVLPEWLSSFVAAQATELQVPPDLPALLALGAVAGGIARKVTVSPWPGWENEPTNLFVMASLPPGERKSQTFSKVFAPIADLERDLQEEARPRVSESDSAIRIAQKRIEHLEAKIAKLD